MRRTVTTIAGLGAGLCLATARVNEVVASEPAAVTNDVPASGSGTKPASDAAPGSTGGGSATPAGSASEAAPASDPTFTTQDRYTTPRPTMSQEPQERRWIRQAPLAGAEPSWGAPGSQMPEYAAFEGPEPAPKGPPPRGTGRIVVGAILGPAGLGLTIAGIVGATTAMLGDHKTLSVPMIGGGLITTALGTALLVDGALRRRRFLKWQAKGTVALRPAVSRRFAGATLVWRF